MKKFGAICLILGTLHVLIVATHRPPARAADTPALATPLALRWTYRNYYPMPAWPKSDRQSFDRAFQPVLTGGLLCFGSSADGKVYALDAASGEERWSYHTDGPIRFAPALWRDRLFVASDDGHLYCLSVADGKLLWKQRGGPDDRMVLGNDRVISAWPTRGGPVVADGIVYFGAGIWPSDGIYLYALDAASGKVLWRNSDSGSIYMGQPHGGANAHSGVAAQGRLVVAGDTLLVPTGRAVPAAFNRADGKFRYFHLQANGRKGHSAAVVVGAYFFNGGSLFDVATGTLQETVGAGVVAQLGDQVVRSTDKELYVGRFIDKQKTDKKGEVIKYRGIEKLWSVPVAGGEAVLVTGKSIVVGGPQQANIVDGVVKKVDWTAKVSIVDAETKKVTWSVPVDGEACGLAVDQGRLYVSTDQGTVQCYAAPTNDPGQVILGKINPWPYGKNEMVAAAAQEIIDTSGVTEGYCVDLSCGDGALAFELAQRTKLHIYAVDADPAKVALARRNLEKAGLYGTRVTVHRAEPAKCPYPRYFADLVVSGRSLTDGPAGLPTAMIERLQRPHGGVACVGKPGQLTKQVRGPLAGAGNWTHQYADPANTSCSADALVRGPLRMLWYRDSDFDMPQRHGRGPAPLYFNGRLYVEGLNAIRAVDAYNGRMLWEYPLPKVLQAFNADHLMGTAGTGSNMCLTADGLYIRAGDKCLRLDLASGKKLAELAAPKLPDGKPGTWGYIACENGILLGSLVNPEHIVKWRYKQGDMSEQYTESAAIFALDALTGQAKWLYRARTSVRHNAVALGGGRVYLIDRPPAEADRFRPEAIEHAKGELLALDADNGKVLWKSTEDVFGTLLALSVKHDALLMSYQPTAFRLPSERGGQMAVFRATNGQRLWDKKAAYSTRPMINDRTILAQGGAWDLLGGGEQTFDLKRSYGCGQLACSTYLVVYRSATLGYHDLLKPEQTVSYGGIRPGCWINALPAGGLVLVPDASAGCSCSYLNQAWIALQPPE